MSVKKPKEISRESYRSGVFIERDLLPQRFPFTSAGWRVDAIEMMAAGVLADGREFQEIRVYARHEKPDLKNLLGDPISARDVAILGGDPSL